MNGIPKRRPPKSVVTDRSASAARASQRCIQAGPEGRAGSGWHAPTLPRDDGGVEGEQLWRALAPQVLGALVRRYGDFDRAEDAVQEALLAASTQWPRDGMPHDPRAWLVQVASRRLIDHWRSDAARARRERADADALPADALVEAGCGRVGGGERRRRRQWMRTVTTR